MSDSVKQMTVVSGKGGTGKTSVLASFVALAENKVIADCDVDASNLYLIMHPDQQDTGGFRASQPGLRGACTRRCHRRAGGDGGGV